MNDRCPSPLRQTVVRWLRRAGWALGGFSLVYAVFIALGFVPVNRGRSPPPADDRVRLLVRSNELHTDVVMPVTWDDPAIDWRDVFPPGDFRRDVRHDRYVAIGWGDRRFFTETPRWSDLRVTTTLQALFWPSDSVLHVEYLPDAQPGQWMHEFYVTREQYRELARYVEASISPRDQRSAATPAGVVRYGDADRFYHARGRYHLFNTSNQWTGRALKRAGVPVGIWTPLKAQVLWWLPRHGGQ